MHPARKCFVDVMHTAERVAVGRVNRGVCSPFVQHEAVYRRMRRRRAAASAERRLTTGRRMTAGGRLAADRSATARSGAGALGRCDRAAATECDQGQSQKGTMFA